MQSIAFLTKSDFSTKNMKRPLKTKKGWHKKLNLNSNKLKGKYFSSGNNLNRFAANYIFKMKIKRGRKNYNSI